MFCSFSNYSNILFSFLYACSSALVRWMIFAIRPLFSVSKITLPGDELNVPTEYSSSFRVNSFPFFGDSSFSLAPPELLNFYADP